MIVIVDDGVFKIKGEFSFHHAAECYKILGTHRQTMISLRSLSEQSWEYFKTADAYTLLHGSDKRTSLGTAIAAPWEPGVISFLHDSIRDTIHGIIYLHDDCGLNMAHLNVDNQAVLSIFGRSPNPAQGYETAARNISYMGRI
jgi:hypothetical protein